MNELSNKALILLDILKRLGATDEKHRTNIYEILKKLEEVNFQEILPEEPDYELENLECEMTRKSVSTTLASLVRKGLVNKTGINSVQVGETIKNLREYYLA